MNAHLFISLVILGLASGCLVPTVQPDVGDTSTTGMHGTTATASTSASDSMTSAASVPDQATSEGTGATDGTSTTEGTTTTPDASESNSSDEGPAGETPDGGPCMADSECASSHCFTLPTLGGICSECESDEHCADITGFGCSPPDFAQKPYEPAVCGDGGLGSGCETTQACAVGLTCEVVLAAPPIFTFQFCSECASHADCDGDMLCEPIIQLTEVTGHWGCVAPGSTPIGESCDHAGDGDLACASGNCATASLEIYALMGLCSECDADEDCPEGWGCQAADIDTAEVVPYPAVCVQRG